MPKDPRPYITVPLDYYRHPKVARLSIEAREGFLLLNIEARIAKNDGRFAHADAEFVIPRSVLDELVASHPTRPLVVRTEDCYLVRDFVEHQLDEETRERRAEASRENGMKGGRPRKPKTQPKPSQVPNETQQNLGVTRSKAESESESELEGLTTTYVPESSYVSDRARTESDVKSNVVSVMEADGVDVARLRDLLESKLGVRTTLHGAAMWASGVLDRSKGRVSKPTGYCVRTIGSSGPEIVQDFTAGRIPEAPPEVPHG